MSIGSRARSSSPPDERGFTLPEVLTTIAILGILIGIAISMWNSVIESRRVDSAANQLASDMRLAHSSATNQLTDWRMIYEVDEREYHLVKLEATCDDSDGSCQDPVAEEIIQRRLPDGTEVVESSNGPDSIGDRFNLLDSVGDPIGDLINDPVDTSTIEFNSDGGSYAASGPNSGLKVGSSSDNSNCWKITVLSATSRVNQDKEDGCN